MSTASLTSVMSTLFSAPLEAVCDAELRYRAIWANWLEQKIALYGGPAAVAALSGDALKAFFDTAPVVSLDGTISTALTMRIAAVKETTASARGGLQIGPIYAGGAYSSTSRSAEESVFQATTQFTLSNHQANLSDYLAKNRLMPASGAELGTLVQKLLPAPAAVPTPAPVGDGN